MKSKNQFTAKTGSQLVGGQALHSCVLPNEAIFFSIDILIIRQAAHLQLGNL